jgi:hypothetical protein
MTNRDVKLGPQIEYEVWQNGDWVAGASDRADAEHYLKVYGQDGPVEAKTSFTYRYDGFHDEAPADKGSSADADTHRATDGAVVGWQDWPRAFSDQRYEINIRDEQEPARCPFCEDHIDQTSDVTIIGGEFLSLAHTACIPEECPKQPSASVPTAHPWPLVVALCESLRDNDDPNEPIADNGASVLDGWRDLATRILSVPGEGHGTGVVGWQPIETAPRDGTRVDLWTNYGERVADAKWDKDGWREWSLGGFDSMEWVRLDGTPTHWMPLPPPPAASVSMGTSRKASETKAIALEGGQ